MASSHQQSGNTSGAPALELSTHIVQFVNEFDSFLESVRGLTHGTRRKYCRFIKRFLAEWEPTGQLDWSQLSAKTLRSYIRLEQLTESRRPSNSPFVALRAMLRYLDFKGLKPLGIEAVIPRIRKWRHAALPARLSVDDVEKVIACAVNKATVHPLRDRTIVLLIARTGIRASEAARLTLDDIDWGNAIIHVRNVKSRHDRDLPLAQEVGHALLTYLTRERPRSVDRTIFLSTQFCRALADSSTISKIVRHALTHANIKSPRGAAHLLRHVAATNMLKGGASFKNIADVLGHRSLESTAIYAKLDLPALSGMAMPWPGDAP